MYINKVWLFDCWVTWLKIQLCHQLWTCTSINSRLCLNVLEEYGSLMNIDLCWQSAMLLLFIAFSGQSSTYSPPPSHKQGWYWLICCYSSLLINSDNTLVTVMLTINHTGRPWNWGADGKTYDECSVPVCLWVGHIVFAWSYWLHCMQLSVVVLWEILQYWYNSCSKPGFPPT